MDLIGRLHEIGVLSRGEFILKSGKKSDFYIDMRKLVSHPSIIKKIVSLIYNKANNIQCIAGVPQGGVPYSTYLSALYNIPMVFIRKKAKTYGKCLLVEGNILSINYFPKEKKKNLIIEVSGINPDEINKYLIEGIDYISTSSSVTKSNWIDLSMRYY